MSTPAPDDVRSTGGSIFDAEHRTLTFGVVAVITVAAFEAMGVITAMPVTVREPATREHGERQVMARHRRDRVVEAHEAPMLDVDPPRGEGVHEAAARTGRRHGEREEDR